MLNRNECGNFEILYSYVDKHENEIYQIFVNDTDFTEAKFDTDYETDNGLDLDDKDYEEYFEMLFEPIEEGHDGYIIVNYHTLPYKVMCNGEVIY